jgi:hypothetical protein
MVRSKINIRIFITFLIPLKLKANYTIKSLQSEYQYKGIHKSKFEKCVPYNVILIFLQELRFRHLWLWYRTKETHIANITLRICSQVVVIIRRQLNCKFRNSCWSPKFPTWSRRSTCIILVSRHTRAFMQCHAKCWNIC